MTTKSPEKGNGGKELGQCCRADYQPVHLGSGDSPVTWGDSCVTWGELFASLSLRVLTQK